MHTLYLKPGEMVLCTEPTQVSTVLGSCVSLTLFSPEHRVGAICHALLPTRPSCDGDNDSGFRYVDDSIRHMLMEFLRKGIHSSRLVAKLFGGSDLMAAVTGVRQSRSIGRQNIEVALSVLEETGLVLAASDLGGEWGRKLVFHTHTGEVFIKRHIRPARVEASSCLCPRSESNQPSRVSQAWDKKSKC